MKYYLIAGEASGDLHASNLMRSLKKLDNEADFRFFGGGLLHCRLGGGSLLGDLFHRFLCCRLVARDFLRGHTMAPRQ